MNFPSNTPSTLDIEKKNVTFVLKKKKTTSIMTKIYQVKGW